MAISDYHGGRRLLRLQLDLLILLAYYLLVLVLDLPEDSEPERDEVREDPLCPCALDVREVDPIQIVIDDEGAGAEVEGGR